MDVVIHYSPTSKSPCGSIKRITTPLESGWDVARVGFKVVDEGGVDKWCLAVEQRHGDGWVSKLYLKGKTADLGDYMAWLESGVAYITVDGDVYWAAPGDGEQR